MLRWWTICHSFHRILCTNKRSDLRPTGPAFLKGCSESERLEADKTCKKYLGDSVADLVTHNPLGKQLQLVASGFQLSTCDMWSWNCQKLHKQLPLSLSSLVLFGHEKKIVVLFQDFFQHPGTKNSGQRRLPLFLLFSFAKALFWCSNFAQIPSDLGQPPVGAALQGFENSLRNCVFDVCNGALSHLKYMQEDSRLW